MKKGSKRKKIDRVAWLALFIAVIGGIPGLISVWDYYNRTSVKLVYDKGQSIACRIKSNDKLTNSKLAILLHRIHLVGKGLQPIYLTKLDIALKCKDKWLSGTNFQPKQKEVTDKNGGSMMSFHMQIWNKDGDIDDIYAGGWVDFKPTLKGLQYGEHAHFSLAAYFDADEINHCNLARVKAIDTFGNAYQIDFALTNLITLSKRVGYPNLYLVQDE